MSVQLPLFAEPVRLDMSFEDILGAKAAEMPEAIRRQRWAVWLKIARKRKASRDAARYWQSSEGCCEDGSCVHLRGKWCKLMGLPASVNPRLSFGTGMIGMACMGAGHEPRKDGRG